jgi:hypothetical protein
MDELPPLSPSDRISNMQCSLMGEWSNATKNMARRPRWRSA